MASEPTPLNEGVPSDNHDPRREGPAPADASSEGGAAANGKRRRPNRRESASRRAPAGPRHQSRMLALMALYEIDLTGHDVEEVIDRTLEDQEELGEDEEGAPPVQDRLLERTSDVRSRVERLIQGVLSQQAEIDLLISAAAPAFPLRQFSGVDRNVLRLATYELLEEPDVPVSVAINEAVELAKRFGGENSGRFVNGTLGTISERLGAPPR